MVVPVGPGEPRAKPIVCPACEQIANGIVGGYLTLFGKFTPERQAEFDRLIANESVRAAEDNPLSRIMERVELDRTVVYHTTTEHLAQRLGRAIERAFGGSVDYEFLHENKVARVVWTGS